MLLVPSTQMAVVKKGNSVFPVVKKGNSVFPVVKKALHLVLVPLVKKGVHSSTEAVTPCC